MKIAPLNSFECSCVSCRSSISKFSNIDKTLSIYPEFRKIVDTVVSTDKNLDLLVEKESQKADLVSLQKELAKWADDVKDGLRLLNSLNAGREYDKVERSTVKPFPRHDYYEGHLAECAFEESCKGDIKNAEAQINKLSSQIKILSVKKGIKY